MRKNILLNTDSYKASHFLQYPQGTEQVYSYIEARGNKDKSADAINKTVFFGLQIFIQEYLTKPITQADIDEAAEIFAAHGEPFNREGWEYILKAHHGYLPVRIRAVPEGTKVPLSNVLVDIVNTDPKVPWLTSYLETALLRAVWYPTTVASISRQIKETLLKYYKITSDEDESQVLFKLHDFGARGVSSEESAAIGGAAHLVNFMGTDTISGIIALRRHYGEVMSGYSIPAAEHSTITSWGKENEVEAYRNMLNKFAVPGKLVAVVSDSYDIFNAASNLWGGELKDEVIKSGATVIIRPDSGDPKTIVVEILDRLGEKFGYTVNNKGFKVLPSCVRVIQGDGINHESIKEILANMAANEWSIDNVAFGMGGALLQHMNRDTLQFAMKCSAIRINGVWNDVFKDPVTDSKKKSKRGILALINTPSGLSTVGDLTNGNLLNNIMQVVYEDGVIRTTTTLAEVRARSNA